METERLDVFVCEISPFILILVTHIAEDLCAGKTVTTVQASAYVPADKTSSKFCPKVLCSTTMCLKAY